LIFRLLSGHESKCRPNYYYFRPILASVWCSGSKAKTGLDRSLQSASIEDSAMPSTTKSANAVVSMLASPRRSVSIQTAVVSSVDPAAQIRWHQDRYMA
jgi:hypothetical protein